MTETKTEERQGTEEEQPATGEPTPTPSPPQPGPEPGEGATKDEQSEAAKAYAKLREAEKREREANAKLKKYERENMPELERVTSERDDARAEAAGLQQELDRIKNEGRVSRIASRLNFHDPDVALALLSGDDLETDASVESALKRIAKEKPFLVKARRRSGGAVTPAQRSAGGNAKMNDLIRSGGARR